MYYVRVKCVHMWSPNDVCSRILQSLLWYMFLFAWVTGTGVALRVQSISFVMSRMCRIVLDWRAILQANATTPTPFDSRCTVNAMHNEQRVFFVCLCVCLDCESVFTPHSELCRSKLHLVVCIIILALLCKFADCQPECAYIIFMHFIYSLTMSMLFAFDASDTLKVRASIIYGSRAFREYLWTVLCAAVFNCKCRECIHAGSARTNNILLYVLFQF